jgi:hypothetical protein
MRDALLPHAERPARCALDRSGRVAVASTALINLGYGLGPSLGGRVRQIQLEQGLDSTVLVAVIAGATFVSNVGATACCRVGRSAPTAARS